MEIQQWVEWYGTHDMVTPEHPQKCLDEFKEALEGKRVFLYGGGSVGNTFNSLFARLGITVTAGFDLDYTHRALPGLKMYSPKKIVELVGAGDVLIIAANWRNQEVIRKYLNEQGIGHETIDGSLLHSPLQRSFCAVQHLLGKQIKYEDCSTCFIERNYCDILRENLLKQKKGAVLHKGKSKLPMIGVICGNICTLRCDHCVESVPHSRKPRAFEPKDKLLKAIRRLTEAIEFVTTLDFVGGEPFLHPDLPCLIEESLAMRNIGFITVFTNGTVPPSRELLKALQHEYVVVNVSDYSRQLKTPQREKIKETLCILRGNGVATSHVQDMTWYDMSSFRRNDDNEEELKKRFSDCRVHSCHRLYDNKMFRCLHLYAGYVTGNLPMDETILDIYDGSVEELAARLDEFWNQPYSSACRYCELPYISKLVPSGAQVESEKQEN